MVKGGRTVMQKFNFRKTKINGPLLINSFIANDDRGGFIKDYNIDVFSENKLSFNIKEVFHTISKKGVIRAIHFQKIKQQAKLIRCVKGRIYDVIVDLRLNSPNFGKWEAYELSDVNNLQLYIPPYFGHGYLVLEDSIVSYKCNEVFYQEYDSGIKYDDLDVAIQWPFQLIGGIEKLILSDKDKNLQSLLEYREDVMKNL
jgi:dTDP-4-dehydrorhamnose 3,5-epimerase